MSTETPEHPILEPRPTKRDGDEVTSLELAGSASYAKEDDR